MLFSLLLILALFVSGIVFLTGVVLFLVGKSRENQPNWMTRLGMVLAGTPLGAFLLVLAFSAITELFTAKPTAQELAGVYHIAKITGIELNPEIQNTSTLQFFEDGTFTLSPTPYLDVCTTGTYTVDYGSTYNELSFRCEGIIYSAHIVREFQGVQIEFIIGDPDSGNGIFFERLRE